MLKQEAMKKKERKMCVCLCVRVCFKCLHANRPFKHYFSSLFSALFHFTCLPDLFFFRLHGRLHRRFNIMLFLSCWKLRKSSCTLVGSVKKTKFQQSSKHQMIVKLGLIQKSVFNKIISATFFIIFYLISLKFFFTGPHRIKQTRTLCKQIHCLCIYK